MKSSTRLARPIKQTLAKASLPVIGSPLGGLPLLQTRPTLSEWRWVAILQALFLLMALVNLDGPFVSTHFVRQNYTFDVARHVFRDGFPSILTPKGSFSQLSDPADAFSKLPVPTPSYTICHLEVPFYGIIGWPFATIFTGHETAVVRLVAVVFSILSIGLLYLVLRYWHDPPVALFGTILWTTAPILLHFGQVPMPDILTTTGMAAAFFFCATRKHRRLECMFSFYCTRENEHNSLRFAHPCGASDCPRLPKL